MIQTPEHINTISQRVAPKLQNSHNKSQNIQKHHYEPRPQLQEWNFFRYALGGNNKFKI